MHLERARAHTSKQAKDRAKEKQRLRKRDSERERERERETERERKREKEGGRERETLEDNGWWQQGEGGGPPLSPRLPPLGSYDQSVSTPWLPRAASTPCVDVVTRTEPCSVLATAS